MPCCTELTPTSLPNGTVGTPYSQTISAVCEVGGTSAITLSSGTLPTGLIFTAGTQSVPAIITGTPTTSGTFIFFVRLINGQGPCSDLILEYTIVIGVGRQKKKKRLVAYTNQRCPDEIIFRADVQHLQVSYCNQIYNFYSTDENGLLHYIKASSNISFRGTKNWWTKFL